MQSVPNFPTPDAAVGEAVETFMRSRLQTKGLDAEVIEQIVAALRPRLIGIPALNLNSEIPKPDRGLSRKEKIRRVEQDAAEFVASIRNWVDEIIGFFVAKMIEMEIEKATPERTAIREENK